MSRVGTGSPSLTKRLIRVIGVIGSFESGK